MTRRELWDMFVSKNPALLGNAVTIQTRELRRMYDIIWDEAYGYARKERGGDETLDKLRNMFGMEDK